MSLNNGPGATVIVVASLGQASWQKPVYRNALNDPARTITQPMAARLLYACSNRYVENIRTENKAIKPLKGTWKLQVPCQHHALRHFHPPFKFHACTGIVRDLPLSPLIQTYQISSWCHAQAATWPKRYPFLRKSFPVVDEAMESI